MKISTKYNRLTERRYTLTTSELKEAVRDYIVKRRAHDDQQPLTARREYEIEYGDCHDEAVILTCAYTYEDAEATPIENAVAGTLK